MNEEMENTPALSVSFYPMNRRRVEIPPVIPDFLHVRSQQVPEAKEESMSDLPRFTSPKSDLDEMLHQFDQEVHRIEENFDSLKGSLAALGQGLKKVPPKRQEQPAFHGDLDQIFVDFDKEVHRILQSGGAEPLPRISPNGPSPSLLEGGRIKRSYAESPDESLDVDALLSSIDTKSLLIEEVEPLVETGPLEAEPAGMDSFAMEESFPEEEAEPIASDDFPLVEAEPIASDDFPLVEAEPLASDDFPLVEAQPLASDDFPLVEAQPIASDDFPLVEAQPLATDSFLVKDVDPLEENSLLSIGEKSPIWVLPAEQGTPSSVWVLNSDEAPIEADSEREFVIGRDFIEDSADEISGEDLLSLDILDEPLGQPEEIAEEPAFVQGVSLREEITEETAPIQDETAEEPEIIRLEELSPISHWVNPSKESSKEDSHFDKFTDDLPLPRSLDSLSSKYTVEEFTPSWKAPSEAVEEELAALSLLPPVEAEGEALAPGNGELAALSLLPPVEAEGEDLALSNGELAALSLLPPVEAEGEELAPGNGEPAAIEVLSPVEAKELHPAGELEETAVPMKSTPSPDIFRIDAQAEAALLAQLSGMNASDSGTLDMLTRLEASLPTSSSSATQLSKDELATVMREVDNLLEYLPNHKIEELAHKDFYFLYLRLMDDLGL